MSIRSRFILIYTDLYWFIPLTIGSSVDLIECFDMLFISTNRSVNKVWTMCEQCVNNVWTTCEQRVWLMLYLLSYSGPIGNPAGRHQTVLLNRTNNNHRTATYMVLIIMLLFMSRDQSSPEGFKSTVSCGTHIFVILYNLLSYL